jgi:ribosomal protein S2
VSTSVTWENGIKYGSLHLYGTIIHIINLYKTAAKIEEANEALKKSLHQVKKYIVYKKQTKDIVAEKQKLNMPYITEDGLVEC